jgi:tRNA nucleotidyltransferase (CCA-adding enzyme)
VENRVTFPLFGEGVERPKPRRERVLLPEYRKSQIEKLKKRVLRRELLDWEKNRQLEEIGKILAPFTRRVYLVGGIVRDTLLGRTPKEGDIEVYDLSPRQFEKIMKKLGAKGVGKSFFVLKWGRFDISLPRQETKIGSGHRGFQVELESREEVASRRRDFTINSLMVNLFTGELKDYHGGVADLERGVLRHISPKTFPEDSLRVLRGVQFAGRLGFKIAPETITLARQIDLSDLSRERVWGEFEKLKTAPYLFYSLYYLIEMGVAEKLWGLTFTRREFYRLGKIFRFNPHWGYFLYHLRHFKRVPVEKILTPFNPPRTLRRVLTLPPLPRRVSNRFLMGLGLRSPLETFITLNLGCCGEWASGRNLLRKKFRPPTIDPHNPRRSILEYIKNQLLEIICQKGEEKCIIDY